MKIHWRHNHWWIFKKSSTHSHCLTLSTIHLDFCHLWRQKWSPKDMMKSGNLTGEIKKSFLGHCPIKLTVEYMSRRYLGQSSLKNESQELNRSMIQDSDLRRFWKSGGSCRGRRQWTPSECDVVSQVRIGNSGTPPLKEKNCNTLNLNQGYITPKDRCLMKNNVFSHLH